MVLLHGLPRIWIHMTLHMTCTKILTQGDKISIILYIGTLKECELGKITWKLGLLDVLNTKHEIIAQT